MCRPFLERSTLIVGVQLSCQAEVGLCRSPGSPTSPWPGSRAGQQVVEGRLRAGLQLAAAEGVKLDVARDDLARADHPLVVISELFPLGHNLQARGNTGSFCGASAPGSRAAGRSVCSWKGIHFFKQHSRELFMWHLGSPRAVKVPVCVPSHRCVCEECACPRPAL